MITIINYNKVDSKIFQYDLDSIEFKFGMWITKKEYRQRLNKKNSLPKGQFYMSIRVVAKDIETTDMIARRLIKEFTKLDIIKLVSISRNPKKGSIYEYLVQVENNTVENTVTTQYEHSKSKENQGVGDSEEHSKNTVGTQLVTHLKSKYKEKNSIYSIFNYWNSKNIVRHKEINKGINAAINKALKTYSEEDIKKAISNYEEVIHDDDYFFNYKWNLTDFLNRKNGIFNFLEDGSQYINYKNYKSHTAESNVIPYKKHEERQPRQLEEF